MTRKKRPILQSLGGQARAEALSPERRKEIAAEGAKAAAAARAQCEHEPEKRFSPQTGKPLPGKYCRRCRRKLS